MLAVALTELGLDPSYAIGGDLTGPGTNAQHGAGDIFVAEADESDRSFQKYDPEVAIVLNVELDHHANYASMDEIYESFETFVGKVVPGGTLVISADQPGAVELASRVRDLSTLKVVTYGAAENADVRVHKVTARGLTSEVTVVLDGRFLTFTVSVPGRRLRRQRRRRARRRCRPRRPRAQSGVGDRHVHRRQAPPPAQGRGGLRPGDRLVRAPPDGDDSRPRSDARRRP